jgi:hypothetical protein
VILSTPAWVVWPGSVPSVKSPTSNDRTTHAMDTRRPPSDIALLSVAPRDDGFSHRQPTREPGKPASTWWVFQKLGAASMSQSQRDLPPLNEPRKSLHLQWAPSRNSQAGHRRSTGSMGARDVGDDKLIWLPAARLAQATRNRVRSAVSTHTIGNTSPSTWEGA